MTKTTRSLYATAEDDAASRRLAARESQEYFLADTWTNPRDGSLMRLIPAGDFVMGSSPEEIEQAMRLDNDAAAYRFENEMPQFRARVVTYYISVYPVTNGQFVRFLNATHAVAERVARWVPKLEHILRSDSTVEPYYVEKRYEQHPVTHVTWAGAVAYCDWAELRLPHEIEWEKAARGADGRLFPWGDAWSGEYEQWRRELDQHEVPTAPVDAFPEGCSPYGIYQMAGNVDQWCADPYRPDVYRDYAEGVLEMPVSGHGRVVRGAARVDQHKVEFRCAMRRAAAPGAVVRACIGFRCATGRLPWTRRSPNSLAPISHQPAASTPASVQSGDGAPLPTSP